jgi:DNA repair protein RadA/Sms
MVEVVEQPSKAKAALPTVPGSAPRRLSEIETEGLERLGLPLNEFARVLGGGVVPGSLVLVGGEPGIGKCVTGDTRVLDTTTGDYLPITAWADNTRPVLGIDAKSLHLSSAQVARFHQQGRQPIAQVTTKLGRTLRCTLTHPLLTPEGWQPVSNLSPGTRIATPRCLPFFGHEPMPEAEIKLIAYILSGGSAQKSISVTNALPAVAEDLGEITAAFGMQLTEYPKPGQSATQYRFTIPLGERQAARDQVAAALWRVKNQVDFSWAEWARRANVSYSLLNVWRRGESVPSEKALRDLAKAASVSLDTLEAEARDQAEMTAPIARFLEDLGLRFSHAADKFVPDCIFRLPCQQLALFLNRLFSCDGSVFVNKRGLAGLSYSTTSRRLAEDVHHLLMRFGIITKLRTKRSRVNGANYIAYELTGVGAKRVQEFVASIGIPGREETLCRLESLSPRFESTVSDTVPTGEQFWSVLNTATNRIDFREISERAGVFIRDRRHERPLRRSTVAGLADAFPHPRLSALGHGDVYWDEIESITPEGEEEVYDLTVPGLDSFVANDLIVHNSTLLLQIAGLMAESTGKPVLYVSGEESARQIKMRAKRLSIESDGLFLVTETGLEAIFRHAEQVQPQVLIVDSVQTVTSDELTSAAGSISQVRQAASRFQWWAKAEGVTVFLVGHVTKEGAIAGPKVLEHIVDTVLYLEGDRFHTYRLLRSVKNRFGPTSEVGVFEMRESGLVEVTNPSEAFLAERMVNAPGSAIAVTMEGTRPLLVEVQALASHTSFGNPRRTANGVDFNRLLLITAVLARRVGLKLFDQDVFVNVVGGLQVEEPAADLATAVAIASSLRDRPVAADLAIVGEVGLSGEVRAVSQMAVRLKEAAQLGFHRCLIPKTLRRGGEPLPEGIETIPVRSVAEAVEKALV